MPPFEEQADSLAGSIRALEVGETVSKTTRIAVGDRKQDINETLARMRNSFNQCVSKIRKATSRKFRVESTSCLTDDRTAVLCTVAATRLKGRASAEEDVDI